MADTKTPRLDLAVRRIEGHLVTTKSRATWAVHVLPTRRWAFLTQGARETAVQDYATRWAQLAGHETHLRVTWRPHPVMARMKALDDVTPRPLGGKYEGSTWSKYLMAGADRMRKSATDDKVVFLAVRLTKRKRAEMLSEAQDVAKVIAAEGMDGREATTSEVEWMLRRSVGLGLPDPATSACAEQTWEETDLYAITDGVRAEASPFAPVVKVTRAEDGTEGYVATLTLGRVDEVPVADAHYPWMTLTESFPFPVDISARLKVMDGATAKARVGRNLLKIKDQVAHYGDHHLEPPTVLDHQRKKARRVEHDMTRGQLHESATVEGHYQFAVPGKTAEQALDRAKKVIDAYRRMEVEVLLSHGTTSAAQQHALARSFIVGEPVASKAHVRRASVMFPAAGMPTVSSKLGDNRGIYFGHTLGAGRRAVCFDPYYAMEIREKSGAIAVVGDQGSGKSTLLATKFIYPNVMRGIMTRVLDPAGTLAALCDLPEFAGIAEEQNLLDGAPGSLSPFAIVRDPEWADFNGDEDAYRAAMRKASQRRKRLARDALTTLLPSDTAEKGQTRIVLLRAITATEATVHTSLHDVLDNLMVDPDGYAKEIGEYLRGVSETEQAELLFAPRGERRDDTKRSRILLKITSMRGLVLPPPSKPRREWSDSEQMAMAVFNVAAYDIMEDVYSRPADERKMVIIDEGHALERISVGQALVKEGTRGSRKWNLSFVLASQNPEDIVNLGIANLLSASFIGRTTNEDAQRLALTIPGVPQGVGYEKRLGKLSPPGADGQRSGKRQFMMRDVDGRVDIFQVDALDVPHVLAQTDTTANPNQWTKIAAADDEMLAGAMA